MERSIKVCREIKIFLISFSFRSTAYTFMKGNDAKSFSHDDTECIVVTGCRMKVCKSRVLFSGFL